MIYCIYFFLAQIVAAVSIHTIYWNQGKNKYNYIIITAIIMINRELQVKYILAHKTSAMHSVLPFQN